MSTQPSDMGRQESAVGTSPIPRDEARQLIEVLEDLDVPSNAISLEEHTVSKRRSRKEGPLFGDLGKGVLLGALGGALAGAGVGALVGIATDIEMGLAVIASAAFGAFVGVAMGGMGVVRFASPAWREAGEDATPALVRVIVGHTDRSVVDAAIEAMQAQGYESTEVRLPLT